MSSAHRPLAEIVLYGAGGHSKVVLALIEAHCHYEITGVLDGDEAKRGIIFTVIQSSVRAINLRNSGLKMSLIRS